MNATAPLIASPLTKTTPVPAFYDPKDSTRVYKVDYMGREKEALAYRQQHDIKSSASDKVRVLVLLIDVQLTFCHKDYELYVAGAEQDNDRICHWLYEHLGMVTKVQTTLDTHYRNQIFHPHFWINAKGDHPTPGTQITNEDVTNGVWVVNPEVAPHVASGNLGFLAKYVAHYTKELEDDKGSNTQRFSLTIWPYHAMLGGLGHALVPAIHEAVWFHECARASHTGFEVKGGNALTENYSVFRPEVMKTHAGQAVGQKNAKLISDICEYDAVIVGGQAASHCFAWSMFDYLNEIVAQDPKLAERLFFVRDWTSPVVIPGIIDFTNISNEYFEQFAKRGVNIVHSTTPVHEWPRMQEIFDRAV